LQLQVIKADGTQEPYLHTKVIATFVNAFVEPAEKNTFLASQLAESVTYYLYNCRSIDSITSSEIFSMIKAVLSSTGFDCAAQVLAEHNYRRNLLRSRVQVVKAGSARIASLPEQAEPWNKSKIINSLIAEHNLDSASARTIASLVEEKILNSGFHLVPADFVKFLVNWLIQSFVEDQPKNPAAVQPEKIIENLAVTDDRFRQPQNGFCKVEA
jgi:transcriptional regulator NrdR family protein